MSIATGLAEPASGIMHRAARRVPWTLAVGLLAIAVCLPFARSVLSLSDEGVVPHAAERMLAGERIYQDFFEFLPPLSFMLTAAWFKLAGISFAAIRALAILSIAGIAGLTFAACRAASRNTGVALILTVGWLVTTQGNGTQLSHHWLATLFAMAAVLPAIAAAASPRHQGLLSPVLAGLAGGAAAMITPHRGAVVLAAAAASYALARVWRSLAVCVAASCAVPAAIGGFLLWQGTLWDGIEAFVIWPMTRYAPVQAVPFGFWADAETMPLKYAFPLAAVLLAGLLVWRRAAPTRLTGTCAAFALAGLAGCYPRPDIFHIGFAVPLALPLIALCAARLSGPLPAPIRLVLAAAGCALVLRPAAGLWVEARQVRDTPTVVTARGPIVWFGPPGGAALIAQIAARPASEKVLFYPMMALAPVLTGHREATKFDTWLAGYSTGAHYRDACRDGLREAAWVAIDRHWTQPEALKAVYPALPDARPAEAAAFEAALDQAFALESKVGTFELRRRRPEISEAICEAIPG